MPTSSISAQKLNCKCSSCIYVLNYHLRKSYLHIIRLPFCTFWRWWWMQRWPYKQRLNIQHSSLCSSQLLFHLCYFQQFFFLLLPHLCSLLCISFSLTIDYNFSIAFFAFILLWIPKLRKRAQLLAMNANYIQRLPYFFMSLNIRLLTFTFSFARHLLVNTQSLKLIWPITTN